MSYGHFVTIKVIRIKEEKMTLIEAGMITLVAMLLVFFVLAALGGALVLFKKIFKEMKDD